MKPDLISIVIYIQLKFILYYIPYSEKFWWGKILAILPKSRFGEKKFGEWRLQKFYSPLLMVGLALT